MHSFTSHHSLQRKLITGWGGRQGKHVVLSHNQSKAHAKHMCASFICTDHSHYGRVLLFGSMRTKAVDQPQRGAEQSGTFCSSLDAWPKQHSSVHLITLFPSCLQRECERLPCSSGQNLYSVCCPMNAAIFLPMFPFPAVLAGIHGGRRGRHFSAGDRDPWCGAICRRY